VFGGEGFDLGYQLKSVTCDVAGTSYSFEEISHYEQFSVQQVSSLTKRFFFYFWRNSPQWARASSFTRFLDHTATPYIR
jgi:hypothetical protein